MHRPCTATLLLVTALPGCALFRPLSLDADRHAAPRASLLGFRPNQDERAADGLDEDFDDLEQELVVATVKVPDPLEGWNRGVFVVNDALYVWVGKPVAQTYETIMPLPVRTGIRNFFANLGMPVRAINCLLQNRWQDAGNELSRFGINSTLGILGILDVAQDEYKIAPENADLGQTLAVYGIGNGCYLVWPVLGPSTIRDSVGTVGDRFMNPIIYVRPWYVPASAGALNGINTGSFRYRDYDALRNDAVDPYMATRQAYLQYRHNLISTNAGAHD